MESWGYKIAILDLNMRKDHMQQATRMGSNHNTSGMPISGNNSHLYKDSRISNDKNKALSMSCS